MQGSELYGFQLLWSITDRASEFYRWLKERVVLPPESGGEFMCDLCVLEARKAALHSE